MKIPTGSREYTPTVPVQYLRTRPPSQRDTAEVDRGWGLTRSLLLMFAGRILLKRKVKQSVRTAEIQHSLLLLTSEETVDRWEKVNWKRLESLLLDTLPSGTAAAANSGSLCCRLPLFPSGRKVGPLEKPSCRYYTSLLYMNFSSTTTLDRSWCSASHPWTFTHSVLKDALCATRVGRLISLSWNKRLVTNLFAVGHQSVAHSSITSACMLCFVLTPILFDA